MREPLGWVDRRVRLGTSVERFGAVSLRLPLWHCERRSVSDALMSGLEKGGDTEFLKRNNGNIETYIRMRYENGGDKRAAKEDQKLLTFCKRQVVVGRP
jgi:hypothetical protein